MNVILLETVENLGSIGDLVKVKPGYGRNYLLPQGKAALATPENMKQIEARRAELEKQAAEELAKAKERSNAFENLQVVVQKDTERVVLLYTQAHYRGEIYSHPDAGVAPRAKKIRGPLTLLDDGGRPDERGRHAAVFVEWGGHGIYGIPDRRSPVVIDGNGEARFEGSGWVLRPAAPGEEVRERWGGSYRWVRFTYETDEELERVVVDPDNRLIVDRNRTNNSFVVEPERRADLRWALKLFLVLQNLWHTLGAAVG